MKKILILFLITLAAHLHGAAQDVFLTTTGTTSFFSATPIEDIDATSTQTIGAINVKTKSVFFKVPVKTFAFKKALMQEHFNENYIESDKYPYATFSGNINEPVDLTKDGTYKVTTTGKLNVHGVDQSRTIPGTIVVSNGQIDLESNFEVKVADHQIKIPTVVVQHIAEVVQVTVHAVMTPMKSDK